MQKHAYVDETGQGLSKAQVAAAVDRYLAALPAPKRLLLVVPDYTRYHSGAGAIANHIYHRLKDSCEVDLLEALGTHLPMTSQECADMYGDIPFGRFIAHDWRNDVVALGEVPADFVAEVSEGLMTDAIPVQVNRRITADYDLILSIGQVVPHEVVGMANYSKNILVGCGGSDMINRSHMLGAFYGMERIMGKDHSPVRKVFDYAQRHFLDRLPLHYILSVTTAPGGDIRTHGLFLGKERDGFEQAVALSRQKNLIFTQPLDKVVVYLDPAEFKSTWLGNKAVYRTRMAIADGGALVVLAPGVDRFGEDTENDRLIRKYGYTGREHIIDLTAQNADLRDNLSAAAHLIHGSSDGRFTITYCTAQLSRGEVEGAGYRYMPYAEAASRYNPLEMTDGYNELPDGERVYFISNPALGLWADPTRF